ncbi:MAG: NAD(P)H-dependent oxidoreductase [Proteobacteria bacterium]|nr:NAD(P)H-dependent oxidoreductase [Pseudomonadota bacterium]MBU1449594.1 NAD(P)H-dependent oxidoreductase [Pseudomonadota bacterium]MBU2469984.1 NAD(P)H-dependent oxidoreductase [Pseudomonadota bacterium]MBU2516891.1 NAD(P)H-dependent oxidoreductase [Pseudomonadota bacterium]
MIKDLTVIGLVGSPNPKGHANQLVSVGLEGAALAGANTELVQLKDSVVAPCKGSLPWVCKDNLKRPFKEDALEYLSI